MTTETKEHKIQWVAWYEEGADEVLVQWDLNNAIVKQSFENKKKEYKIPASARRPQLLEWIRLDDLSDPKLIEDFQSAQPAFPEFYGWLPRRFLSRPRKTRKGLDGLGVGRVYLLEWQHRRYKTQYRYFEVHEQVLQANAQIQLIMNQTTYSPEQVINMNTTRPSSEEFDPDIDEIKKADEEAVRAAAQNPSQSQLDPGEDGIGQLSFGDMTSQESTQEHEDYSYMNRRSLEDPTEFKHSGFTITESQTRQSPRGGGEWGHSREEDDSPSAGDRVYPKLPLTTANNPNTSLYPSLETDLGPPSSTASSISRPAYQPQPSPSYPPSSSSLPTPPAFASPSPSDARRSSRVSQQPKRYEPKDDRKSPSQDEARNNKKTAAGAQRGLRLSILSLSQKSDTTGPGVGSSSPSVVVTTGSRTSSDRTVPALPPVPVPSSSPSSSSSSVSRRGRTRSPHGTSSSRTPSVSRPPPTPVPARAPSVGGRVHIPPTIAFLDLEWHASTSQYRGKHVYTSENGPAHWISQIAAVSLDCYISFNQYIWFDELHEDWEQTMQWSEMDRCKGYQISRAPCDDPSRVVSFEVALTQLIKRFPQGTIFLFNGSTDRAAIVRNINFLEEPNRGRLRKELEAAKFQFFSTTKLFKRILSKTAFQKPKFGNGDLFDWLFKLVDEDKSKKPKRPEDVKNVVAKITKFIELNCPLINTHRLPFDFRAKYNPISKQPIYHDAHTDVLVLRNVVVGLVLLRKLVLNKDITNEKDSKIASERTREAFKLVIHRLTQKLEKAHIGLSESMVNWLLKALNKIMVKEPRMNWDSTPKRKPTKNTPQRSSSSWLSSSQSQSQSQSVDEELESKHDDEEQHEYKLNSTQRKADIAVKTFQESETARINRNDDNSTPLCLDPIGCRPWYWTADYDRTDYFKVLHCIHCTSLISRSVQLIEFDVQQGGRISNDVRFCKLCKRYKHKNGLIEHTDALPMSEHLLALIPDGDWKKLSPCYYRARNKPTLSLFSLLCMLSVSS